MARRRLPKVHLTRRGAPKVKAADLSTADGIVAAKLAGELKTDPILAENLVKYMSSMDGGKSKTKVF
tara:strand:- start:1758 stop:1958 length:201 start_codon:yes stop_codon:yes gene_type:complete